MKQRGFIVAGWMYLVGAIAVLAMLGGLFLWVDTHWETSAGVEKGEANKKAEWDKANREQREKEAKQAATAATKKEAGDAKAKVVYRTITQTVDRYIDRPIYRNQCFDDDGLRDANTALRGPSAPSAKPDKPVPGPVPALRWDRSLSVAKAD